jgi:lysyl-tRNA synthetase class 2
MNWRPSSGVDTARRRARMLARAREFFAARGVLEVETPALSPAAVSDPHIESIEARLELDAGKVRYLRTSPEFFMKRLLAAGYPDSYEIGKVFRDGEAGPRHQPEFTLVEWYRLGFGLRGMVQETVGFLSALLDARHLPQAAQEIEYGEAFLRYAAVDVATAPIPALAEACGADDRLLATLGERRDDWLDLVLATRIAPQLPRDRLTVLYHYPRSQAALARLCPEDPSVADRFEVFLGEVELANGFVELRDAKEQAGRIDADQARRRQAGQAIRPRDHRFLAALEHGLPACAGVAAGFDRLLMINEMTDDIRQVQTFAFEDHDA